VQPRLGVDMQSVEVLLNILLVCYQAMKESGLEWPLISEDDQERQMQRMVGAVKFSQDIPTQPSRRRYVPNTSQITRSSRCSHSC